MIYDSLIHPYLTYCINVRSSTYRTNFKSLCTAQKRSVRTLFATVAFHHKGLYNITIQHDIIQYITHVITHFTHFTRIVFLVALIEPSTLLWAQLTTTHYTYMIHIELPNTDELPPPKLPATLITKRNLSRQHTAVQCASTLPPSTILPPERAANRKDRTEYRW